MDMDTSQGSPQLNPTPHCRLIGHRGAAGLKPENTFVGFKKAADLNLNWIEIDTHLTQCKNWVVIHDEKLDRTTTGQGFVADKTLSELEKLEAGLWFTPPTPGEKIPTLAETINFTRELGLQLNIEVKGTEQHSKQQARRFANFIVKHCPTIYPSPLISSFDKNFLVHLRALLPTIPIGYLVEKFSPDVGETILVNHFTSLHCDAEQISVAQVQQINSLRIPVLLYTVNDPIAAKNWLENKVYALFTDVPDQLLKVT